MAKATAKKMLNLTLGTESKSHHSCNSCTMGGYSAVKAASHWAAVTF
jgi:hypothetical protein